MDGALRAFLTPWCRPRNLMTPSTVARRDRGAGTAFERTGSKSRAPQLKNIKRRPSLSGRSWVCITKSRKAETRAPRVAGAGPSAWPRGLVRRTPRFEQPPPAGRRRTDEPRLRLGREIWSSSSELLRHGPSSSLFRVDSPAASSVLRGRLPGVFRRERRAPRARPSRAVYPGLYRLHAASAQRELLTQLADQIFSAASPGDAGG